MREKLIELIGQVQDEGRDYSDVVCVYPTSNKRLADHLIANGVTIPVRCKECEKWQRHTHVDRERGHCRRFDMTKHESGFCDRGERRTDD